MHGIVGPDPLTRIVPGNHARAPMSAAKLQDLLCCPHRFLLAHVLGFRPRQAGADHHRVDAMTYGALVHRVSERFSEQHGPAFGTRQQHLEHWRRTACELADAEIDELLTRYPLVGKAAIAIERQRLRRDVLTLIDHDWDGGRPRAFVGVERSFGSTDALAIPTALGPIFVAGRIDRLDIEHGVTLIRDFKTGRAHPRVRDEVELDVALDLQLAMYAVVTEYLASSWGIPADVAASYVYADRFAIDRERSFRTDRTLLRTAGRRWIDLAMGLIHDGGYVQSPDANDCRRCPFSSVCGERARTDRDHLRHATGYLAAFRELKT
jgi:RecB family exonuclease